MIDKIKEELDKYLEFDSDLLFKNTDYLVIFGGAIRDIISGDSDTIKDVDIMCLPKSRNIAIEILENNEYSKMGLVPPELYLLYKDIHCIFEPKTYMKGKKIVQFITPKIKNLTKNHLKYSFFNILKNVDLSSSGVLYDGVNIYESFPNSIIHCKRKVFTENKNAIMYNNDRIIYRIEKLFNKEWKELNMNNINNLRIEKIGNIKNTNFTINDLYKKLNNQKNYGKNIKRRVFKSL